MTNLSTILSALLAQRTALMADQDTVTAGMNNPKALYADSALMDRFAAAHDRRKEAFAPLRAWLTSAIGTQLAQAIVSCRVHPLPDQISSPFVDRWNRTLNPRPQQGDYVLNDVHTALVDVVLKELGFTTTSMPEILDARTVEALIASGTTTTPHRCNDDMLVDFWNGSNLLLTLDGWQPTLFTMFGTPNAPRIVEPRPDTTVFHTTITFPSGRVLVADKLPFGAVQDAINETGDMFNINYGAQRLIRSMILMHQHNILQISVGNTNPHVYHHEDNVLVGHIRSLQPAAGTCTDLWMTTMVDVETLQAMGVEDKAIAEAIASGHVQVIDINPGLWNVVWSEEATQDTTANRFESLYPHSDNDRLAFWMTQTIDPVKALTTVKVHTLDL